MLHLQGGSQALLGWRDLGYDRTFGTGNCLGLVYIYSVNRPLGVSALVFDTQTPKQVGQGYRQILETDKISQKKTEFVSFVI